MVGIAMYTTIETLWKRHSTIMRMWSPKGRQPRVISASTRQKVGFFGAINVKTGQLITKKAPVSIVIPSGSFCLIC